MCLNLALLGGIHITKKVCSSIKINDFNGTQLKKGVVVVTRISTN